MSSSFHPLRISQIRQETEDAISLCLEISPEQAEAFHFTQGQHLVFRHTIDGAEQRRSYSICSSPQEGQLRVAVKRVADGLFSSYVHQHWQAGQTVEVMPPDGRFFVPLDATHRKHYLGIAAGSGITPLLSIIKTTLATEPHSRFTLLYGNQRQRSVLFAEELAALKSQYLTRFAVYHFLSREAQQPSLFHGRLDRDKLTQVWASLVPIKSVDEAFICGPNDMIDSASASLEQAGLAASRIHFERFGLSEHQRRTPSAVPANAEAADITVILDGQQRQLPLAKGQRILEAAVAAGLALPYSCQAGVCCTCRAKVLSGEVSMDKNFSLEPAEVAQGFVLTCQARPLSQQVVLSFDER